MRHSIYLYKTLRSGTNHVSRVGFSNNRGEFGDIGKYHKLGKVSIVSNIGDLHLGGFSAVGSKNNSLIYIPTDTISMISLNQASSVG